MKRVSGEIGFTRSGISFTVYKHYKNFAAINVLAGMMSSALMFNAVFLKESGLSATEVGLFSSIASLCSMFAPMFWGVISDKYKTVKKILYISLFAMLLFYLPIPLYAKVGLGAFSLAAVMIPVQALFSGIPEYMGTAWLIVTQKQHPELQYGVIRMFFTGAYAVMNLAYMLLIKSTSVNSIFFGYAAGAAALMIVLLRIPDIKPPEQKRKVSFRDLHIGRVFKNRVIILYMVFMSFACIPVSSLGLFTPYLLEDIGVDAALLGGMTALRSVVALPVLYFSGRLVRRLGYRVSLLIGTGLCILQQLIYVFCGTLGEAFVGSALGGFAMGIMLPSEIDFVNKQAPEGLVATTQTICGTVYSIAGVICNLLGGVVVDSLGVRIFYAGVAGLLAIASVFFFVGMRVIARPNKITDSET